MLHYSVPLMLKIDYFILVVVCFHCPAVCRIEVLLQLDCQLFYQGASLMASMPESVTVRLWARRSQSSTTEWEMVIAGDQQLWWWGPFVFSIWKVSILESEVWRFGSVFGFNLRHLRVFKEDGSNASLEASRVNLYDTAAFKWNCVGLLLLWSRQEYGSLWNILLLIINSLRHILILFLYLPGTMATV